jgi:hypothetical protein
VAGIIILMQDYYQRTTGNLPTVDQLEKWLRAGAVTINDGDDEDDNVNNTGLNFLRVDALAAMQAAEAEVGDTYSVSGTVTASGAGLSGVVVTAGTRSATTIANGTYSIAGLTPGTYVVTPVKAGYTFAPVTRSVAVNANVTGVNFTATKTAFSISGTVRASSGLGLSGATLQCGALTTTSDAGGNYSFAGLAPAAYTVSVSRSGYIFNPASQSITVGPDKTSVDFTGISDQTPTYSISGTVTANGSGLSGVTVSAGNVTALSTANGTYALTGLVSGSYTVSASRSGYTLTPSFRTVVLNSSVSGIDFSAALNTFSISGTVRQSGTGMVGVTVTAGSKSAITNSAGQYTLSGLISGTYTVAPLASGFQFSPASASIILTSNTTNVDFSASLITFRIEGKISQDGVGAAGITLNVGGASVTTDGSGNYSVTGLAVGTYTVQPTSTGYQFSPSARSVTVGPDRTASNFTAVALRQIQGKVTLNGAGIPGIVVAAGTRTATTNASGDYTLANVPTGTYTVTPSGGGYTFDPASRSVSLGSTNVSGINFAVVTTPHLISLTPKVAQVVGGKSTSITATFDRPATVNTYVYLTSSAAQGKVAAKVLVKKGSSSASFSLTTKVVKTELAVTLTGTQGTYSAQTLVTLTPKPSRAR